MLAGEVKLPRTYLKAAFKVTYIRFAFFFIGSALCVGIVIPYNDKTLMDILSGSSEGAGTAAASPYVIAMKNLGVNGLPHLTNALLLHLHLLRRQCVHVLWNALALQSSA
jgi:amino acid transporter